MASQIDVVNLTLLQLGDEIILSMDEDTKAARTMNVLWEPTVLEVLADANWGFATKRATLAQLSTTPEYKWTYAYQLPSDFIRMICMGEPEDEKDWAIEGSTLVTDDDTAQILYVAKETNPGMFPPKFVTALSLLLLVRAADTLAGLDTSKKDKALAAYEKYVRDAATVDSQNQPQSIQYPTRWINARL